MVFGFHLLNDVGDDAFFVDDEGGAGGAHVSTAVHRLLLPHAVGFVDGLVFVGQQREGQFVLVGKLVVRLHGVAADADHFVTGLLQFRIVVAQVTGLGRAAGSIILGVEVEHYFLALEVGKAHGFAPLVEGGKVGGGIAGTEVHGWLDLLMW